MSDCPGALAKLVFRKMYTKTSLMKLNFLARKAVHDCYQCWKFELKISSDSGDMHFSAIKRRWGGCPPLRACKFKETKHDIFGKRPAATEVEEIGDQSTGADVNVLRRSIKLLFFFFFLWSSYNFRFVLLALKVASQAFIWKISIHLAKSNHVLRCSLSGEFALGRARLRTTDRGGGSQLLLTEPKEQPVAQRGLHAQAQKSEPKSSPGPQSYSICLLMVEHDFSGVCSVHTCSISTWLVLVYAGIRLLPSQDVVVGAPQTINRRPCIQYKYLGRQRCNCGRLLASKPKKFFLQYFYGFMLYGKTRCWCCQPGKALTFFGTFLSATMDVRAFPLRFSF